MFPSHDPEAANLQAWYKLDQSANWEADTAGNWQIPDNRSAYPQSFNFNGSSDYISASSDNLPTSNYTFSAWVKISSFGDYGILGYGDYSSIRGSNAFRFESSPIQLKNYWYGDDFNHSLTASQQNEILNNWAHVAVTYDSSIGTYGQRVMYLNGTQIATNNPSGAASFNLQNFTIGATRYPSSPEYFNGKLSNVQVWNTALSTTQVETLYNNGIPLTTALDPSNLQLWYKLDSTSIWNPAPANYWTFLNAADENNSGALNFSN